MGSQCIKVLKDNLLTERHFEEPWLDQRGTPLCTDELKPICQQWTTEIWERYLQWFETPRSESLMSSSNFFEMCEGRTQPIFELAQASADAETRNSIEGLFELLTDLQRQVLVMVFWQGLSERQIAETMRVNQKSVHRVKVRALNAISRLLKEGLSSRRVRGEITPLPSGTGAKNGKEVSSMAKRTIPKAG